MIKHYPIIILLGELHYGDKMEAYKIISES